jgi:hypothetical protein
MRIGFNRASMVLAGLFATLAAACGGNATNIPKGPMPGEGSWTGVFHSPQYGEMNMIQNGAMVAGEYKKDEREGKLQGEADGNYMKFEWEEKRMSISNRATTHRGHGYFLYMIDPANGDHIIKGRWGMNDDDSDGGEWNAYKQKNKEPKLRGESSGGESDDDSLESDSSDSSEDEEEESDDDF